MGEHEFGRFAGLGRALYELDEASLAAAAGVDLGFDDAHGGIEFFEGFGGFFGRADHFGGRDGDSIVGEDLPGLIFVDFHGAGSVQRGWGGDKRLFSSSIRGVLS
jgi:hypothetical protein